MLCYIIVGITLLFQNVSFADAEPEECGTINLAPQSLVLGGVPLPRGEIPWHATIYSKNSKPYRAVCAGSLVTKDKIISVAHCYWSEEKHAPAPVANYAAAVGKVHRPWEDLNDDAAQNSDLKEIHLPLRFAGLQTNLQDDIALLVVSQPFTVNTLVRPVCLNFDHNLERMHLQAGSTGKLASWMLDSSERPGFSLRTLYMPYVELSACISAVTPDYREYITADKFCAGTIESNSSLCRGNSGAGLVFPFVERGKERYYLRGVASSASLTDSDGCAASYSTFTQISKHEHFLTQFLN